MAKLLTGSINLSKIDQNKLFTGKTGDKFLNISIWINEGKDQYGNIASIQQSTKKDEPKIFVGNLKPFEKVETVQAEVIKPNEKTKEDSDDLPF
jgi:hypothetical protein